ncbi:hypothetical protein PpBr36_08922 [Pyricularia pennisetigena]|uniref:hypothetical protein n=1 Tax=Pyricularia pennisetigena TaxID=1578925 RepID=UPI001153C7A2|nr:hypothetical protein PpBr36_08922 [Pyricularia pennisetigena]TLS24658.1 hypothetical protein PpBr36_08922 [Pyricularia pennisetigena]
MRAYVLLASILAIRQVGADACAHDGCFKQMLEKADTATPLCAKLVPGNFRDPVQIPAELAGCGENLEILHYDPGICIGYYNFQLIVYFNINLNFVFINVDHSVRNQIYQQLRDDLNNNSCSANNKRTERLNALDHLHNRQDRVFDHDFVSQGKPGLSLRITHNLNKLSNNHSHTDFWLIFKHLLHFFKHIYLFQQQLQLIFDNHLFFFFFHNDLFNDNHLLS